MSKAVKLPVLAKDIYNAFEIFKKAPEDCFILTQKIVEKSENEYYNVSFKTDTGKIGTFNPQVELEAKIRHPDPKWTKKDLDNKITEQGKFQLSIRRSSEFEATIKKSLEGKEATVKEKCLLGEFLVQYCEKLTKTIAQYLDIPEDKIRSPVLSYIEEFEIVDGKKKKKKKPLDEALIWLYFPQAFTDGKKDSTKCGIRDITIANSAKDKKKLNYPSFTTFTNALKGRTFFSGSIEFDQVSFNPKEGKASYGLKFSPWNLICIPLRNNAQKEQEEKERELLDNMESRFGDRLAGSEQEESTPEKGKEEKTPEKQETEEKKIETETEAILEEDD